MSGAPHRSELLNFLLELRGDLRSRGLAGTLRSLRLRFFPPRTTRNPFDAAHGTDTGGLIEIRNRDPHPSASHARDYWGTPPSVLRGILAQWSATLAATGYTIPDYTFVDLGCGKGRAVMLASELPFAASVGVELSPELAAAGQANLVLWSRTPHPCPHIRILHADALAYPIPDTPTLLFLFNPFDAHILTRLATRLAELLPARRHPLDIAYLRAVHTAPIESIPGIRTLWKGNLPLTPEDTAADIFDTREQDCILYRIPPAVPTSA